MARRNQSFTLDSAIGTDAEASDFQYTGQNKTKQPNKQTKQQQQLRKRNREILYA